MNRNIHGRPEPFTDSRERVADILVNACGRLPRTAIGHAAPDLGTVRAILAHGTTRRISAAVRERVAPVNRWRFLKHGRTRDDIGRAFIHRLQWHTGRGSANLWTVHADLWNIGENTFNIVDTVAAVFVELFNERGLDGSFNNRWRGVLACAAADATKGE